MTRRSSASIVLLLALGLVALPASLFPAHADALADAAASLEPAVTGVKTAGKWQKDGREGVYRVVVMRDAAGGIPSRLFVQWLAVGADGTAAFDHGIEVTEVGGEKLDIADITTENDPDGLTVFVQTQDAAAGGGQSYELFINDDGTYRFGPASN